MRNYPTPTPARKVQFKDDLNPFSSPITESKDKMCEELNASLAPKIPLKDSVCDDLSPSFAPEVESKDTACDDPNFAGKVQFQDAVYDHFNPSSTPKDESEDTACDDLNSSLSPKVGQKKETSVDAPIPAAALKTGDKKLWSPCANPGNPIFSCMSEVPTPSYRPVPFVKPQNPLYKTTSAEYGSNQPTCEIAPSVYHPLTQSFSATLQNGGMYRNRSLNTGLDKNRVHDLLQY